MKKFLEKTIENNEKQITYYKKIIDKKQTKEDNSSNPAQKLIIRIIYLYIGFRIDDLITKIKKTEGEISTAVIKVKELEAVNKQLEKEELSIKDESGLSKNV